MVGDEGLEPQLAKPGGESKTILNKKISVVGDEGLEPPTFSV